MPASHRTLARTAAAIGAACLIVAPLATGARAQVAPTIPVYEAQGIGTALGMQFAFTPSIFDPLLDLGAFYTTSRIDSAGAGTASALSAVAYPGGLVVGGAGCAGVPGAPWVQAYYPKTEGCPLRQESMFFRTQPSSFNPQIDDVLNQVLERLSLTQVHQLTETDLGFGHSLARLQNVTFAADRNGAPVATIGLLTIDSKATLAETVGHRVTVTAKNVDLLGMFHIGSIESVAETASDAVAATAVSRFTIADATTSIGGTPRRISIDHSGVRVTDPALDHRQRIGLQEQMDEAMLAAGVEIIAASPVEMAETTRAEASVGGLILAFKGAVPSVNVPREAARVVGQVIQEIPTLCTYDFGADLPVCFGAGVLPGPGTAVRLTLNIASASSFTVGESPSFIFEPGGGGGGVDPGDGGFGPVVQPFDPGPPVFDPGTGGGIVPPTQPGPIGPSGPLVGLVARLPAAGLLWGGIGFLVLALGAAFGPSLRHARAR